MTLDQVKGRDAKIVNDALREAFNRARIPTSVAVDDPECLAKLLQGLNAIAVGDGAYGAQAWEYKAMARAALSAIKGDGQ